MNHKLLLTTVLALLTLAVSVAGAGAQDSASQDTLEALATPVGTAFTYQGYLTDGSASSSGASIYDFQFILYTDAIGGSQVGPTVTKNDTQVDDGLFTVKLDFGVGVFNGDARYLEIGVRPGNSPPGTPFTILSPRQELAPAPYALALPGVIPRDGKVGIGTSNPTAPLHVQAGVREYVTQLENTATDGLDVLLLKMAAQNPNRGYNFISFVYGDGKFAGDIDVNGTGGVSYNSYNSDFAEWLPRLHVDEVIEPGDIVGNFGGKIAIATQDADQVHVVSTAPIVLGNTPDEETASLYETIAFVGQAPVKVRGAVQAGDYIVPSGLNDGTGVSIAPQVLTLQHAAQIVGRAWESSSAEEVKLITVAVGLPQDQVWHTLLKAQEARLVGLEERLALLESASK